MRNLYAISCAVAMLGCQGAAPDGVSETAQPVVAIPRPGNAVLRIPVCTISWQTVDDFMLNGTDSSAAASVLSDPASGNVYAAGSGGNHWIVRVSEDRGTTWSIIDDFVYGGMNSTSAHFVGTDGLGDLFVGGRTFTDPNSRWLMRVSTDLGATWTVTDDYQHPTGITGNARGFTTDVFGTLYTAGFSDNVDPSSDQYHWIVRSSTDGGNTWSTADDATPIIDSTGALAMTGDNAGNVYAAGYNFDYVKYHWQVRKLAVGGTTWATVDDYNLASDHAFAQAAVVHLNAMNRATILVGGYAIDGTGLAHWIARSSTDQGATWTTSDDFLYAGQFGCLVRGMTFERVRRNLYATGKCWDGTGYHWVTRKSADAGATWATEDDFVYAAGFTTYANGISSGGAGNVFAAGFGNDGTNNHWIIRKQVCQ